jgi:hypothetical protein
MCHHLTHDIVRVHCENYRAARKRVKREQADIERSMKMRMDDVGPASLQEQPVVVGKMRLVGWRRVPPHLAATSLEARREALQVHRDAAERGRKNADQIDPHGLALQLAALSPRARHEPQHRERHAERRGCWVARAATAAATRQWVFVSDGGLGNGGVFHHRARAVCGAVPAVAALARVGYAVATSGQNAALATHIRQDIAVGVACVTLLARFHEVISTKLRLADCIATIPSRLVAIVAALAELERVVSTLGFHEAIR